MENNSSEYSQPDERIHESQDLIQGIRLPFKEELYKNTK